MEIFIHLYVKMKTLYALGLKTETIVSMVFFAEKKSGI